MQDFEFTLIKLDGYWAVYRWFDHENGVTPYNIMTLTVPRDKYLEWDQSPKATIRLSF